ncbi:MAG TPA: hypothetical protein VN651_01555 [Gemmatimonadaceae bacterium]|nr:hypothetical protein [Gemmatimonadaceae bacterium]
MLPNPSTLDDAALRRLETTHTLSNGDWRAVLAEIARRAEKAASSSQTSAVVPSSAVMASALPASIAAGPSTNVRITGVDLPFDDLFKLTFKITLASALSALTIGAALFVVWMFVAPFIR